MQKKEEGGRSLCLGMREWCVLGNRLAWKTRTISQPPLFTLPCLSDNSQDPRTSSLNVAEYHWLTRIPTDSPGFPSALFCLIGHSKIAGRHWILPGVKNFLQKTVLTANREQTVHGMGVSGNVSMVTLPIMFCTQGSMAIDPRAINGAW